MSKAPKIKNWITAHSDRFAYPILKKPDGSIWHRHSTYKTKDEAKTAKATMLASDEFKNVDILDFFDGTNQRIFIYVVNKKKEKGKPICVITYLEQGKPTKVECFTEEEKKEQFDDIKRRGLTIIDVKNRNKMAAGGDVDYRSILEMPREKRIEFILKSLREDPYYSEKRGGFELIAEKVNEIAEKYFPIDRENPIHIKGDSVYFEPDERTIKRDGYLVAQAKYATHLVSFTPDKTIRFYDKQKVRNIDIIMEVIKNPDARFVQKNGNIVYLKNVSVDNSCCSIFRFEINVNGNLTMVGLMPEQRDKDVRKRKASGFWSDASFGHFPPKLPSEKVTPNVSGSGNDDTGAYNKDINNTDKTMKKGGKTDSSWQLIENQGERIVEYPVDESMEVANAGSAIVYRFKGKDYEIITWNKHAKEHRVGDKTIGVGEERMTAGGEIFNEDELKKILINEYNVYPEGAISYIENSGYIKKENPSFSTRQVMDELERKFPQLAELKNYKKASGGGIGNWLNKRKSYGRRDYVINEKKYTMLELIKLTHRNNLEGFLNELGGAKELNEKDKEWLTMFYRDNPEWMRKVNELKSGGSLAVRGGVKKPSSGISWIITGTHI
jgi:hypothetical protein